MKPTPTPLDALTVQVTLTIGTVNTILVNLAEQKLADVIEPFTILKSQTENAIEQYRKQQAGPRPGDDPPEPATPPAPLAPEAVEQKD